MKAACAFDKTLPNHSRYYNGDRMRDVGKDVSSKISVEIDNVYVTPDKLMKYFGKTGNGGGDIKSLIYPYEYKGRKVAVIEFEDIESVESLINRQAVITVRRNEAVALNISKFEEFMTSGSINLNRSLFERMKSTSSDAIDEIMEECNVEINEDACVMKGEWYKLVHAKKKLDALILHNHSKMTPHSVKETAEQNNSLRAAEMSIQVDCHLLGYIKMTDGDNMCQMIGDYGIKEEDGDGTVTLKFLETSNSDVTEYRRKRIEDMIEEVRRNSVKEVFDAVGCNDNKINQSIEAVHRQFPGKVYVCKTKEDPVIFIGPTKDICHNALSAFQSALFDETTMTSSYVDKNHDNYTELDRYELCNNELIVRVLQGNIVDQNAVAIVNAANKHLHGGGGVTGAIYDAGGREFRRRCNEVMQERVYRPLGMGEVLVTEACGRLICKSVLHAAAPIYYECDDEADCLKKMQLTCYNIFAMADSMQFKSVSIPAMGTGIYGVPVPVFCKALVSSVKEICEGISKDKFKRLKEIRLVNYDEYEAREIASLLSSELENSTLTAPRYSEQVE